LLFASNTVIVIC